MYANPLSLQPAAVPDAHRVGGAARVRGMDGVGVPKFNNPASPGAAHGPSKEGA